MGGITRNGVRFVVAFLAAESAVVLAVLLAARLPVDSVLLGVAFTHAFALFAFLALAAITERAQPERTERREHPTRGCQRRRDSLSGRPVGKLGEYGSGIAQLPKRVDHVGVHAFRFRRR